MPVHYDTERPHTPGFTFTSMVWVRFSHCVEDRRDDRSVYWAIYTPTGTSELHIKWAGRSCQIKPPVYRFDRIRREELTTLESAFSGEYLVCSACLFALFVCDDLTTLYASWKREVSRV